MKNTIDILAVDGGGIRGLIPAMVLANIERRYNRPIFTLFDLVVGTSTGSIIAEWAALGKPMQSIVELYVNDGPTIFKRNLNNKIVDPNALYFPKYPATNIETLLEKFFGLYRLSDCKVDTLVPSYDTIKRKATLFTAHEYRTQALPFVDAGNVLLREVCRRSSAAPVYFPNSLGFIDGGVFANNPTLCGIAEVLGHPGYYHIQADSATYFGPIALQSIRVLNLGTGLANYKPKDYTRLLGQGALGLLPDLSSYFMDSSQDSDAYICSQLLGTSYLRVEPSMGRSLSAMDNASPEHISQLGDFALRTIGESTAKIDAFLKCSL